MAKRKQVRKKSTPKSSEPDAVAPPAPQRRKHVRYQPRLVLEICNAIADGKSLRSICASHRMPTARAFLLWVARRDSVRRRYQQALELRGEHFAQEIIEIADELPPVVKVGKRMVLDIPKGWIARQRLRLDTRKWSAARLLPKKYGDKLALTDGDGKPLPAAQPPVIVATTDPIEAARAYQKLMTGDDGS